MKERIAVTATGIVSAMGIGWQAQLQALKGEKSGVHLPSILRTAYAKDHVLGELSFSNEELAARLGIDLAHTAVTRTALLALLAVQELVAQTDADLLKQDLAFISAGTVGGMGTIEELYMDFIDPQNQNEVRYIDTLDCAESTEHVAKYFGWQPLMATISTACSSSANAIILGSNLIRHGVVERAVCGGCDALARFTVNGFSSLKNVDKTPSRPFDQNRFGLNLGEGAAYLLLEKEKSAKERGATILGYLSGSHNSNDAYHPTAPSPDGKGARRTMEAALAKAGLAPSDIGYINAHGTATINNDVSEGLAIQALFGTQPTFSSTKPFTGHTLAAAGAIEAIISIMAMNEGFVPASLNWSQPMEELNIVPVTSTEQKEINHVLSNSFGFGGSNVSLVFSKS